jgi:hypothetical protein
MSTDRSRQRTGNALEVIGIARDDQIPAGKRSDDDGRVDNVASAGSATRHASSTSALFVQILNSATAQQTRQLCLGATAPCLTQDTGRHNRPLAALQTACVYRPKLAPIGFGRKQCAGIVGRPHESARDLAATIKDGIGRVKFLGRKGTMLGFPLCDGRKAILHGQGALGRSVQPGRQAKAVPLGACNCSFGDPLIERNA